jgi:Fusaric acid resistance protein-like/Putative ER transporter, 6TM, N-terminal/Aromatic acid exporter family member 2
MTTMYQVTHSVLIFLQIFFLGHGLATGVALLVFPISSRDIAFDDIREYLAAAQRVLMAEAAYIQGFQRSKILNPDKPDINHQATEEREFQELKARREPIRKAHNSETNELRAALNALSSIQAKLRADLALAKEDVAWTALSPKDLEEMFRDIQNLILPLRGLSVLISIFERLCEWRGWIVFENSPTQSAPAWQQEGNESREEDYRERQEWSTIFRNFRRPIEDLSQDMQSALQHVSIVLELNKRSLFSRRKSRDVEAKGAVRPGDPAFGKYYATKTVQFHQRKGMTLAKWRQSKGFDSAETVNDPPSLTKVPTTLKRNDEEQLFVILYIEHLFHGISDAILDLVKFADGHCVTNPETHKRLIVPGWKRITKLMRNFLNEVDTPDDLNVGNSRVAPSHIVVVGNGLGLKYHPEHLPPKNRWQVMGNHLRQISHFFASSQSNFGFRVSCAVLTVAIVGLLKDTQTFFFNQRCSWAMVLITFSMTPTSGQSLSSFMFRMIGTTIAAIIGIVNWYIADGQPSGVLAVFYIFTFFEFYFIIKYPQYVGIWKVTLITRSIITGYALQTQKTGVQAPPATDSNHYPIYLIAPYRLACTVVGVFVAFVWTVFPSPVTSRSVLRKKLGQSLFLLASYYSAMHATVAMWVSGTQGDVKNDKHSAGRRLEKARNKIFAKELVVLASLREHSTFSKYEPSVGGEFPQELYDKIIAETDVILSHMNLVIYATTTSFSSSTDSITFSDESSQATTRWLKSLSTLFSSADFASHSIATLFALLASSVTNGQPLPPYLEPPQPYHLARQMHHMDPQLLSLCRADEPGFSAFAVIEVSCTMIAEGLGRLLRLVKELVGEVEFGVVVGGEKGVKGD